MVNALRHGGYSLRMLEMHACTIPEDDQRSNNNNEDDGDAAGYDNQSGNQNENGPPGPRMSTYELWTRVRAETRVLLERNLNLAWAVGRDARQVLRAARILMPHGSGTPYGPDQSDIAPSVTSTRKTGWRSLPPEMHLFILSHLAPSLSAAQLARVVEYASDTSTLPDPSTPLGCQRTDQPPPPAGTTMFIGASNALGERIPAANPSLQGWTVLDGVGRCGEGRCLGTGSVRCASEKWCEAWLERVGCVSWEHGE